jgi:hypothetical protein
MPCFAHLGRTLKADTLKFSATSIFINTAERMEGFVLENVQDVIVDNVD